MSTPDHPHRPPHDGATTGAGGSPSESGCGGADRPHRPPHDGATTRARFARSAERLAALGTTRIEGLRRRVTDLVELEGHEVALDAAAGTGPMAMALEPLVREVIAVDLVPEMLDQGRRAAAEGLNIRWLEGDVYSLPLEAQTVDVAAIVRTLHHLERPADAVAELARVVRPGGQVLLVDQIVSEDARERALYERIEVLRDPSHVRSLTDSELRRLLDPAGLDLVRTHSAPDERDLETFVELANCDDETRATVFAYVEKLVAEGEDAGVDLRRSDGGFRFTCTVGWYVARVPT